MYLLHASQNAGTNVFPVPNNGPAFWVIVGILALAAALVAAIEGPEHLSRRRTRQLLS